MDKGTEMRILIVDDEASAREQLRTLLSATQMDLTLVAEAVSGREAVDCCTLQPIDLVLLDGVPPDLDALEIAGQLARLTPQPAVLLLSDQTEPVNGSNCNVIGHLTRPVEAEALKGFIQQVARARADDPEKLSLQNAMRDRPFEIRASYRNAVHKVAVDDVIYLRADQKYVTVRHPRGELLVDLSLRFFEDEFPDIFVRIHRNTLVARSRFAGLQRRPDGSVEARVEGCEDPLVVSRRHLTRVRRWLRQAHTRKSSTDEPKGWRSAG